MKSSEENIRTLTANKDVTTGLWDIEGLEPWTVTFDGMVDMIKSYKPFKFARYGDGEIFCMQGKRGSNCDGHFYYPDLGRALRETVFNEPPYMTGIQPLSVASMPAEVNRYFGKYNTLYNADVLHNASISKQIDKFISPLLSRYVILVGAPHLSGFFTNCVHIITSPVNCWTDYDRIKEQIEFHIDGAKDAVVLLAASMMSEVIIYNLREADHTFIDIGSLLDPYCGVKSRRYHHNLEL